MKKPIVVCRILSKYRVQHIEYSSLLLTLLTVNMLCNNLFRRLLTWCEPTSALEADSVQRVANITVRRKPVEVRSVGDRNVTLTEHLSYSFSSVPVE